MLVRGATREQIIAAVKFAGERFGDNIAVKRLDAAGLTRDGRDKYILTLTVNTSSGPGGRRAVGTGRRIAAACWHAHGAVIDALPDGVTVTSSVGWGKPVTVKPGDTWHDWRVNDMPGSRWHHLSASDLCECDAADAYAAGQTYRRARGLDMPAHMPAVPYWTDAAPFADTVHAGYGDSGARIVPTA